MIGDRFEVKDIAERYHMKPKTVYRWMEKRLIPHSKIGGRLLASQSDLEAFEKKSRRG